LASLKDDPPFPDLGGKHLPEPVPTETDGLVAHFDTTLMQ
jgi:hypothetical protein